MCSAVFDEEYVPHFLQHYRSQGVDHHYIIFHHNTINSQSRFLTLFAPEKNLFDNP